MDSDFAGLIDKFVIEQFLGKERLLDKEAESGVPNPAYKRFSELGLANWWIGKEFGGRGISLRESVDAVARLAYGECGITMGLYIPILSTRVIELFGTQEQKERFLIPLVKNGGYSSMCGSERGSGSELLKISTIARKTGSKYVLNGTKFFATNANFAEFLVVICAAPDDVSGFKAIVVPKGTPGMDTSKRWITEGLQASFAYEVQFSNCEVPAENALEPNGLRVLEVGLNASRLLIAASGIGIGRRMMDVCMDYARVKSLKDSVMTESPVFAAKMGQMEADIETMYVICRASAEEYDTMYASPSAKTSMLRTGIMKSAIAAKILCGQLGWKVASEASTMFGGLGYTDESLIGKLVRDMRYIGIVEGGDDVGRDLIYGRYVKDRSPWIGQ